MATVAVSNSKEQQVVVMEGEAFIRDATGKTTPVSASDTLELGQVIFTLATGHITLMMPNGQIIELGADRSLLLEAEAAATQSVDPTANASTNSTDQILAALNQGKDLSEELEATAAGLNGGSGSEEGSSFVRLARITEALDPLNIDFAGGVVGPTAFNEPGASDGQAIAPTLVPTPELPTEPTPAVITPTVPTPAVATPEIVVATPSITASLGSASVSEGSAAVFTVTLSNPSATPTEVTLNVLTGGSNTASANDVGPLEYFNGTVWMPVIDGKVTVPANETSIQVRVPTIQDNVYEGTETFQLQATVNGQTATGNGSIVDDGTGVVPPDQPGIPDDDRPHILSISNADAVEGNALVFDVKLDHSSTTATTVSLDLQSGSGTVGIDTGAISVSFDGGMTYIAVVGNTINVPANTLDIKVQVATVDDALLEGPETVTLHASTQFEAANALVGTGTITDDVGPGLPGEPGVEDTVLVSISGPSSVIEGSTTTPYTVSLTQAAASNMTIQLNYSGTASDGSDYVKVISVTIPQGASSATFDLQTLDDSTVEGVENIQVSLGSISGGGFEAVQIDAAHASVSTNIVDTDVLPETQNVTASGLEDATSIAINLIGSDSDGNVASFKLSHLPSDGTLYLDAAMTQLVTADTDLVASGNQLTLYFKPNANWNGSTSFEYAATDNEGLVDATPATATISVTAVNDAPTAAGGVAHGTEDTALVSGTVGLNWASFNVADVDSPADSLGIKITSLPADGHLQYFSGGSWVEVAVDQVISKADIDGGHLRFVPDANESGSDGFNSSSGAGVGNEQADYAKFTYQATDGVATSTTATMTIDVEPVADTPSLSLEKHDHTHEHDHDTPPPTGHDGGLIGLDLGLGVGGGLLGLGVLANVGVPNTGDHCNWFTSHSTNLLDLNLNANVLDNVHDHGQLIDAALGLELGGAQALNLFTNIDVKAHEVVTISLDLEMLHGLGAGVDLYWEGCKVATLDVAVDGLCSFVYQLVATKDGTSCLEFRPCDGLSNPCQIDNLCVTKSPDNIGAEDHWITLSKINANLNDTDGSETLSLTMSQIPVGATLSDGVHTFIATQDATSVDLAGWDLNGLKILPPADFNGQFNLTVTATATETANGDQASTSSDICVTVLPEPDPAAPTATGGEVIGREDWPMLSGTACFKWSDFNVSDADSPDHCLGIKITSLPADGQLKYFNGLTWCDVVPNQVISKEAIDHGGLMFIPDRDESGSNAYGGTGVGDQQADYAKFTYQATDGVQTSANATMTIDIEPVADTPWLSLSNHHLIDVTDFQNVSLLGGLSVEANVNSLLSTNGHLSWFTSNSSGLIDLGAEAHFLGNGNLLNNVIELVQDPGKALNLFTNVEVKANEVFTLSVDFAASLNAVGALVDVFWEGHKVATLDSATIALQTFTLNLVASADGLASLEFKAVGGAACILDNLCFIKAPDNIGLEDHWINLSKINTHLLDGDGSETLQLTVGNIPVGAQLSDGVHTFTASAGMTSLDATSWNLDSLKILPPADFNGAFNLSVTATATETANGDQANNCVDICVKVLAVNDPALISGVHIGNVQEDTNFVNGHITASGQLTISDADGNGQECFIPQLNTIGQYGFLSLSTDGQWVYTLANLAPKIQHLDTTDHKVDTFLVMSADGSVQTITINVAGLDEPNHAPLADSHALLAAEGAITPLFIAPPVDIDGDHLTIKISGLPTTGQVLLHDGTPVTNGMELNYHQLSSLLFMAVPGSVSSSTAAGSLSYSVDDGQGHQVNAVIDITILNNPLADLVMGGNGVDNFTLIPWLDTSLKLNGQLAAFFDSLGHAIQLPQLFHDTQVNADLTIMAGQSNDTIELGLSAGNNIVFGGSSLPNNAPTHDLAQVSATAFMQDDVIIQSDGRLTASAALSVQSSATLFDNVNTGSGNDTIFSGGGNMVAHGGAGNDTIYGNFGSDGLRGGSGDDVLAGGKGDDIVRGDSGSDVFRWSLGDQGSAGAPARDIIMDFNNAKSHNGAGDNDKLDFRDLLEGENIDDLEQYLHFEKSGNDTLIHISSKGQFDPSNATHSDVSGKEDQVITLQGVDLTTAGATDEMVIHDLLDKGRLLTD